MKSNNSDKFTIRDIDLTQLVGLDSRLRRAALHLRITTAALLTVPFLNMIYAGDYERFLVPEEMGAVAFLVGLVLFPASWPLGRKLRFAHLWAALLVAVLIPPFLFLLFAFLIESTTLTYLLVACLLYLAHPIVIGIVATFQLRRLKPVGGEVDAVKCLRYQTHAPPLLWSFSKITFSMLYYCLPIFVFILIAALTSAIRLHPIIAFLIAIVSSSAIAIWSCDRAKRLRQMTADEARNRDKRPPALLLRSFEDDELKLKPPLLSGKIVKEASFEEIIAEQLWVRGPVIAIGRPGENVPPVGAARSYYTDDEWQARAEKMAVESKVIAMIVGTTEGLGWEIRRISNFNILRKLLLIFPPIPANKSEKRWSAFLALIDNAGLMEALKIVTAKNLMMISFYDNDQLIVFSAEERRDPLAYHLALAASTQLLSEKVVEPSYSVQEQPA